MKKLVTLAVALFVLGTVSRAQGIEDGNHMFTMSVGAGAGLEDSGVYFHGEELAWGEFGGVFGLSYLVFPTKYFGVGVEVNDGIFAGEDTTWYGAGTSDQIETAMNVFNAMASFRFNFNPDSRARFYIPFGVGLTSATGAYVRTINGVEYTHHSSTQSLGYFAGFGFEIGLGQSGKWALGSELRYNAFRYDTDKLLGSSIGQQDYSYVSASFKASCRF